MRVFLDANVLFSASNPDSNIAALIKWLCRKGTAVTSDLAVVEARKNLSLKRPAWRPVFERLLEALEVVPSTLFELPVPLQEKDAPLLCSSIRNRCSFFVTGDKRDFGHLYDRRIEGVEVISLLRLAEILAAGHGQSD